MWIEKLSNGVLRILTPLGPRYLKPSFLQRVYLLWIFRNFPTLPFQVLNLRQRSLIEKLSAEQRFVSPIQFNPLEDAPLLGTLERRPPVEVESLPPRRPNSRVSEGVAPFAADVSQRS
jgi:hypothetical protein